MFRVFPHAVVPPRFARCSCGDESAFLDGVLGTVLYDNVDAARIVLGTTEPEVRGSVRKLALSSPRAYHALAACHWVVRALGYRLVVPEGVPQPVDALHVYAALLRAAGGANRMFGEASQLGNGERCNTVGCFQALGRNTQSNALTDLVVVEGDSLATLDALAHAVCERMLRTSNAPDATTLDSFRACLQAFTDEHGAMPARALKRVLHKIASGGKGASPNRVLCAVFAAWVLEKDPCAERGLHAPLARLVGDASTLVMVYKILQKYPWDKLDMFLNSKRAARRPRRLTESMRARRDQDMECRARQGQEFAGVARGFAKNTNPYRIGVCRALAREHVRCRLQLRSYGRDTDVLADGALAVLFDEIFGSRASGRWAYEEWQDDSMWWESPDDAACDGELLNKKRTYLASFRIPTPIMDLISADPGNELLALIFGAPSTVNAFQCVGKRVVPQQLLPSTIVPVHSSVSYFFMPTVNRAVSRWAERAWKEMRRRRPDLISARGGDELRAFAVGQSCRLRAELREAIVRREGELANLVEATLATCRGAAAAKPAQPAPPAADATDSDSSQGTVVQTGYGEEPLHKEGLCPSRRFGGVPFYGGSSDDDEPRPTLGAAEAQAVPNLKRALRTRSQRTCAAALLVTVLEAMPLARVLAVLGNRRPGCIGWWRRVTKELKVGEWLLSRGTGSHVSLALRMLHRAQFPATEKQFVQQKWAEFVCRPLAEVLGADAAVQLPRFDSQEAADKWWCEDIPPMHTLYAWYAHGVYANSMNDLKVLLEVARCATGGFAPVLEPLPVLKGGVDCHALLARYYDPAGIRKLRAPGQVWGAHCPAWLKEPRELWDAFLAISAPGCIPTRSYLLQNLGSLMLNVPSWEICRKLAILADDASGPTDPVRVLGAMNAVRARCDRVRARRGEAPAEMVGRPSLRQPWYLGTRSVRDKKGGSFLVPYTPALTCGCAYELEDEVTAAHYTTHRVERKLCDMLMGAYLDDSAPVKPRADLVFARTLWTTGMRNLKPSGQAAPMPCVASGGRSDTGKALCKVWYQ